MLQRMHRCIGSPRVVLSHQVSVTVKCLMPQTCNSWRTSQGSLVALNWTKFQYRNAHNKSWQPQSPNRSPRSQQTPSGQTGQNQQHDKVTRTNHQIASLVPNKGRVGFISSSGKYEKNASLADILSNLDTRKEKLVVVNFQEAEEGHDPQLVCKLLKTGAAGDGAGAGFRSGSGSGYIRSKDANRRLSSNKFTKEYTKKETKVKAKKVEPLEISISWNIAAADLVGQKQKVIRSAFEKGRGVNVVIASRSGRKSFDTLPPLELEKRQLLIEKVKELCEDLGEEKERPEGSIKSRLHFFYGPR